MYLSTCCNCKTIHKIIVAHVASNIFVYIPQYAEWSYEGNDMEVTTDKL